MATIAKNVLAGIIGLALAAPAMAVDVNNITFADFGQVTSAPLFNYTLDGNTNNLTLDGPLRFNNLLTGETFLTTGTLRASSTSALVQNAPQFQQQGFAGFIRFTDGATNYLTATFSDAIFSFDGDGSSGSLISTDPSSPISYTSDIIDVSGFTSRDFGFNISGAFPGFSIEQNGMGSPFVSSLSGSFSGSTAGAVPEPDSWAMLIVGFGLTGMAARRRQRSLKAITA